MALLTDRDLISVRDLVAAENDLLETADRERVEIETKIELGIAEIRTETEAEIDKISRDGAGGIGVFTTGNVVATPGLLRWAHARILMLFYFECYGRQLNERYRVKFEHYRAEREAAKRGYLERGIGVVNTPLPKPSEALVSVGPGTLPAGSYYFAVVWISASGARSGLGTVGVRVADTPSILTVNAPEAPTAASGWDVYLGDSPEQLYRQNEAPLAPGDSWVQSEPLQMSRPFRGSQIPDRYLKPQRIFQRG